MDIYRNTYSPVSTIDRPKVDTGKRPQPSDEATASQSQRTNDRRRQPDRRRRQEAFAGPDRRKRRLRRSPKLLDPKTRDSAALEDRRGGLVDASA